MNPLMALADVKHTLRDVARAAGCKPSDLQNWERLGRVRFAEKQPLRGKCKYSGVDMVKARVMALAAAAGLPLTLAGDMAIKASQRVVKRIRGASANPPHELVAYPLGNGKWHIEDRAPLDPGSVPHVPYPDDPNTYAFTVVLKADFIINEVVALLRDGFPE